MKKLVTAPETVVEDYLRGLALAHGDLLDVHTNPNFVLRADRPVLSGREPQVAVISGGGSGHEPLHCGFVGPGMLHAAVPGPVFTSPPAPQIQAATMAADEGRGVLMIVKNYTGDVMNFETAAELCEFDDVEVASVLVADDVAVEDSTFTAGRRGVAGTLVVEKIAGAAAARGDDLAAVTDLAERAAASVRSMGVALRAGVNPNLGQATFDLAEDEIELGIGIHGEPGRERVAMRPAKEIVSSLMDAILADFEAGEATAADGDVLLFVNGMGATPDSELHLCFAHAYDACTERGLAVTRSLVGSYVTSLDMAGVSITLARLDADLLAAWDAPCHTPALVRC